MKNITVNNSENFATLSVNPKVYSLDSVYSAAYIFLDRAYVVIDEDADKRILVFLKPKKDCNLEELALQFSDELVSYSSYSGKVRENAELVKMVVQRALLSADSSLVQEMEDREIEGLLDDLEKEGDSDIKKVVKGLRDENKKK
jgi:His-Xaa-Ser system protein HxsD